MFALIVELLVPDVIPKLIQVILFGFVMIAKKNTMENVAFVMENLEEVEQVEPLELVRSVILAINRIDASFVMNMYEESTKYLIYYKT